MERRAINPWRWQDRLGYVQGEEIAGAGRILFCAGQTATDGDGRPLYPGDMRRQLIAALDNLEAVLRAAGYGLHDLVRLSYYTTDVDLFLQHHDAIAGRLAAARFTSTLLGVTRLAAADLLVELEGTAAR